MPEYLIEYNGPDGIKEGRETPRPDAPAVDKDSAGFILVNPASSLDFICEEKPCDGYVVITRTDERSLLQCYAYIEVIHERSSSSKVHVVFDDADEGSNNDAVFRKLSRFIHDRLEFIIDFLGSLVRDEHFERSITNQRPLVLFQGTLGYKRCAGRNLLPVTGRLPRAGGTDLTDDAVSQTCKHR